MTFAPISLPWDHESAVTLCRVVEMVCPKHGCHVALTGGNLYKSGPRKDVDLLFYRIRQVEKIDMEGLWAGLEAIGLKKLSGFGWCYKASFNGLPVDCFFPEEQAGEEYENRDHQIEARGNGSEVTAPALKQ
jgi:hypothetical protein